ncbi:ABC transporter ATP-binding protein [Pseudoflavitalea sp. G-6-1-2]|uniref:ABC transporter ATP-binding protein n=1 Tax=Pseudoflavitalea sp. G-6-1-2 TaxID=2728841 RepID=UPI001469D120|nr:ABC transporter ATP-binding protein [Pseudoflavitalea sp. G-6-1-2]NML22762.1 ABC transporter ATP-binding protein [Pseudoflavitalea sp. G-6-1-2]
MINVQNLHFAYRKKPVFTGLDLQLQSGHIYGLLGKNGTGKSTLLRNMAGLLFPDTGSIDVLGFQPKHRKPAFLQEVFMVAEEFHLPNVPLKQYVKYQSPFYPRFSNEQFSKYMQEFEIPADSRLQDMSYGQKKKVLISFGLACNASVLLMDEPTNGLDIMSKSQFRKVMAGALDENKCMVISTHQVKDLESLIDRITIIDEGRILFDQTIDAISRKLQFSVSFDPEEVKNAIYSEASLRGHSVIMKNETDEESKLDLELLYKAIILNREQVQKAFAA